MAAQQFEDRASNPFGLPPKQGQEDPWWKFEHRFNANNSGFTDTFLPLAFQRRHEKIQGPVHETGMYYLSEPKKILSLISERFGEPVYIFYNWKNPKQVSTACWSWDGGIVRASSISEKEIHQLELYTTSQEDMDWFVTMAKPFWNNDEDKSSLYMVQRATREKPVSFNNLGTVEEPPERGNYSPEVLAQYDRALADLLSSDPKGRILLLEGPPGSGKTRLAKGLIHDTHGKADFIVINPNNYDDLQDPELISGIQTTFVADVSQEDRKPVVLILEDADQLLQPRKTGSSIGGLSSALNMGDGLLSSFIDIRLIVTTNAPVDSIDPAITRTGRLSERIHVGELSPQQAQEIYARLLGPDQVLSPGDCKNWMLSDVYSKAREKGWTEQKPEPQHGGGSEKTGQKPKGFAELHAEALQIENEFRDAVANLSLPPTLRHQP